MVKPRLLIFLCVCAMHVHVHYMCTYAWCMRMHKCLLSMAVQQKLAPSLLRSSSLLLYLIATCHTVVLNNTSDMQGMIWGEPEFLQSLQCSDMKWKSNLKFVSSIVPAAIWNGNGVYVLPRWLSYLFSTSKIQTVHWLEWENRTKHRHFSDAWHALWTKALLIDKARGGKEYTNEFRYTLCNRVLSRTDVQSPWRRAGDGRTIIILYIIISGAHNEEWKGEGEGAWNAYVLN